MKRRRGAPVGNVNAYKHGFYSAHFKQHEQQILDERSSQDLVDEIGLVRIATSRFLGSLQADTSPRDIETELSILRAINLGALSINSLVRTRLMLAGAGEAASAALAMMNAAAVEPDSPEQP